MPDIRLGVIEEKFADIIWEKEPLSSSELAKLAEEKLSWKKSTTYTVLKRLCERGLFQNEKGTVTSLMDKNTFYTIQSEQFVDDTFQGSLPAFLTAFSKRRRLSEKEIEDLEKIIAQMKE